MLSTFISCYYIVAMTDIDFTKYCTKEFWILTNLTQEKLVNIFMKGWQIEQNLLFGQCKQTKSFHAVTLKFMT